MSIIDRTLFPEAASHVEATIRHELDVPNPYEFDLESDVAQRATQALLELRTPFIDADTRPDMATNGRDLAVYRINGTDTFAPLAMAVEGEIIEKMWRRIPETTQVEMTPYTDNSEFFLVVDKTAVNKETGQVQPKIAGTLRIADVLSGPSETQDYFLESTPDAQALPQELEINDLDRQHGLWDVVGVFVRDGYRDSMTSVWAYHSLYAASKQDGIGRWITNVTKDEFNNLDAMGIPFRVIESAGERYMERGEGKKPIKFTFNTCQVDAIEESMLNKIASLQEAAATEESEGRKKFWLKIANVANIALTGRLLPTETAQDPEPEDLSFREKFRGLREAARDDYKKSGLLGKLSLLATAGILAYEWGPGNETATPIIAGMVINNTSGLSGLATTAAVAAGFTFAEQTASGALMAHNVSNYPTLAERATQLSGTEDDPDLQRKGWSDLPTRKRLLAGFTLGSTYVVAREAAITGNTDRKTNTKIAAASAALTGAAVGIIATGVDVLGQATDDTAPMVEKAGDVVVGLTTHPATWLSILGISTYLEHRNRKNRRREQ